METAEAPIEEVEIISPTTKDLTVPSALVFKNKALVISSMQKYFDEHFAPMRTHIEDNDRNKRIKFKCPKGHKNKHPKCDKNKENTLVKNKRTSRTAMYDRCEAELVFKKLPNGSYYLFSGSPTHNHSTSEKEYYEYPFIRKREGLTSTTLDEKVSNMNSNCKQKRWRFVYFYPVSRRLSVYTCDAQA